MDKKINEIIEVLVSNNLISKEEITTENYAVILAGIADEIDSLLYISILVDIEERYNIILPEDAMERNVFENIDDFIVCINNKINSKGKEEDR